MNYLITEAGDKIAIEDIDLDRSRAFYCSPGSDSRPGAHTYVVDFCRQGSERFEVIHGHGGEGEAEDFGYSLLYLLREFREHGIEMDVHAVDVRDRLEEVAEAAGLPPLQNGG